MRVHLETCFLNITWNISWMDYCVKKFILIACFFTTVLWHTTAFWRNPRTSLKQCVISRQYILPFLLIKSDKQMQQECIPVGCVPAARRPYTGVCFPGGCLVQGGVVWCLVQERGCLLRGCGVWSRGGLVWGGPGLGGVPGPGWCGPEGCLVWGGSASVPSGIPPPPPPPCEQNDKQVQKYYLGHNFVAAGNKYWHHSAQFTRGACIPSVVCMGLELRVCNNEIDPSTSSLSVCISDEAEKLLLP